MCIRDSQCFVQCGSRLRSVRADEIKGGRGVRFYRTSQFKGKSVRTIKLGSKEVDAKVFCEFMGYYLSEGSCVLTKTHNHKVIISQYDEERLDKIARCMEKLPWPSHRWGNTVWIDSKELYEYVVQFGKSPERYCPKELKELDAEYLDIFLEAFCLGDGHVIPERDVVWDGVQKFHARRARVFTTSSPRLCADICEMLVKIGRRPSVTVRPPGRRFRIRGREYVTKKTMYIIRELYGQWTDKVYVERVPYRGYVYDVTLPKWHTLYVMRKGKCVWSGNCRDCAPMILSLIHI